jgi:hypothetical protein
VETANSRIMYLTLTAAATNLSLNQEMTTRDVAARWVRSAATAATGRM